MTLHSAGSRAFRFVRSIVVLVALVGGVPTALVWAARLRFGGGSPWHGVPSPTEWRWSTISSALTERLTEDTIADVVIRVALVTAWVGLAVFLATVVAEAFHMVRHDGLPLPDVRGLGLTQHAARVIAAGLLVVVPMFASPGRSIAKTDGALVPIARTAAVVVVDQAAPSGSPSVDPHVVTAERVAEPIVAATATPAIDPAVGGGGSEVRSTASVAPGGPYVVRAGDSIFGIAAQVMGDDPDAVADYADRIIDTNLGRDMGDGRRLVNAAFIDVGWVLELPPVTPARAALPAAPAIGADVHLVEPGESLWSIADERLGDPERWPEVYEANRGYEFGDGRVLDDPDLVHPGWELRLPGAPEAAAPDASATPATPATPADGPITADPTAGNLDVAPVADDGRPARPGVPRSGPDAGPDAEPETGSTASPDEDRWDAPTPDERVERPRPDTVWVDPGGSVAPGGPASPGSTGGPSSTSTAQVPAEASTAPSTAPFGLMSLRNAGMLSVGLLSLLAVRRRRQLRRATPRAVLPPRAPGDEVVERVLRAHDSGERLARVDVAIRAAALPLIERGRRVRVALCSPDGEVELRTSGAVELPPPWEGRDECWFVPAATPIELLAPDARQVWAPCPTLVQIGVDDIGRDVFVDLEALEAIEVGGPADHADAIVAAIAMTLASSTLAEVTSLVAVGVPDATFLGHRLHRVAPDPAEAFAIARREIGATATVTTPTFELRARGTGGETWEPAVVLVGSAAEVVRPPRDRTGLAVVSAAPIEGPSSRLAPDDDGWVLRPAGIRLRPIGLPTTEVDAVAHLLERADAIPTIPAEDDMPIRTAPAPVVDRSPDLVSDDDTIYGVEVVDPAPADESSTPLRVSEPAAAAPHPWQLLVRLLGPVDVVDAHGAGVEFERSKTKELVAWLATHRERSTRGAARTALWEHDVRDATFANVVSEARRALARLVAPPPGEEWVGRTMTDALPLHHLVRTDAEMLEQALAAARVQPPDQAILTLTPAVERIAGMPFEGTSYLWPDAEGITSSLVLLATSATAELAAHCLSVGDVEGVFRATGRGLQVLAGHEELIGLRMRAHARVGDLAGVRSEWETYERMIDADPWSDGEPSPKLVDLRTKLLNPSR